MTRRTMAERTAAVVGTTLLVLAAPVAGNWNDWHARGPPSRGKVDVSSGRRELLDAEPPVNLAEGGREWTVGGKKVDYSMLDCPADWVNKLDQNFLCLPKNSESGNFVAGGMSGNSTADGFESAEFASVPFWCIGTKLLPDGSDGCGGLCDQPCPFMERAATDPFGAQPLCETVIDDCTFSTYKEDDGTDYFDWKTWVGTRPTECSKKDSQRQWVDCGIPCPKPFPMETSDLVPFAVVILVFMGLFTVLGFLTYRFVGGNVDNYFVAGRTLPLLIVTLTLASQSFDASAALGNADLGYKYHWWDGAALPIGLGLSLLINGCFFARHINRISAEENMITLPDLFAIRFGAAAEILASVVTLISFLFLLAGNLVGAGKILGYLLGVDSPILGIWIATGLIWLYTVAGGLFSVAYTDVVQAAIGWTGLTVGTYWIAGNMPGHPGISPAYPIGDTAMTFEQMTDGDALDPIPNAIVMNWSTIFVLGLGNIMALDFQARCMAAKSEQVATIGNILAGAITWIIGIPFAYVAGATRSLYGPSSPHAEFATNTCSKDILVVGCYDILDSCKAIPVHPPTCGEWKPDPLATLKLLTCTKDTCHSFLNYETGEETYHPMSGFIGGWMLLGIVAASMSTGDGAILAMGTVWAHNCMKKLKACVPAMGEPAKLLNLSRASSLVFASIAAIIACTEPDKTGYFLIVAFDCVLAGGFVPLTAAIYWPPNFEEKKGCTPLAAVLALFFGSVSRGILEATLPIDGLLLMSSVQSHATSFGNAYFENFFPSDNSTFVDGLYQADGTEHVEPASADDWGHGQPWSSDPSTFLGKTSNYNTLDPVGSPVLNIPDSAGVPIGATNGDEMCHQIDLEDWTGANSWMSPGLALLVLVVVTFLPLPDSLRYGTDGDPETLVTWLRPIKIDAKPKDQEGQVGVVPTAEPEPEKTARVDAETQAADATAALEAAAENFSTEP